MLYPCNLSVITANHNVVQYLPDFLTTLGPAVAKLRLLWLVVLYPCNLSLRTADFLHSIISKDTADYYIVKSFPDLQTILAPTLKTLRLLRLIMLCSCNLSVRTADYYIVKYFSDLQTILAPALKKLRLSILVVLCPCNLSVRTVNYHAVNIQR